MPNDIWQLKRVSDDVSLADRERDSSPVRALANQAFSRAAGAPLIEGNSVRLLMLTVGALLVVLATLFAFFPRLLVFRLVIVLFGSPPHFFTEATSCTTEKMSGQKLSGTQQRL